MGATARRGGPGTRAVHPTRAARRRLNWTQEQLAERAGVGPRTVQRAEAGERLDAYSRQRLCVALGQTAEELGLGVARQGGRHEASDDAEIEEMNRQRFLALSGATLLGGLAGVGGLAHLQPSAAAPRVDARLVDDLRTVTRGYARQRGRIAPTVLLPAIRSHLAVLEGLLPERRSSRVGRDVRSLMSEAATVGGWLAYLAQNVGDASTY